MLYMWQNDAGLWKIGIGQSSNPMQRARQSSAAHNSGIRDFTYVVLDNPREIEKEIHSFFTVKPYYWEGKVFDGYTEFRYLNPTEVEVIKDYLRSLGNLQTQGARL